MASEDPSAGAWIAARLGGQFGAVTRVVPRGYAAYARICHPASDESGASVTWSEVARSTGRRAHALMQWHALVGSADPSNTTGCLWPGASPRVGNLGPETLEPLCELLANHTNTSEDCSFGVWEGWGGFDTDDESALRLLRLPQRNYVLFAGPLHAALELGTRPTPDRFLPQSPNLFWPADRAWFGATEIDFDSTLVGGTSQLVDALSATPRLDSWPIGPEESLAADADRINPVPG
jgi:hypothetical protein